MTFDMSVELRPLLLGYLTFKELVEQRKILSDVEFIVSNLRKKGISVEFKSSDEVDVLLDYWKHERISKIKKN